MLKIEEFNSEGIKYVESKDFEVVNCTSERNKIHDCKSLTFEKGFDLKSKISNKLSLKFKNAKYKILVYSNELYNRITNANVYVLLSSKEQIEYLKSFNEFKEINFDILKEEPKETEMTFFEQNVRMWCNEFHRYITNQFDFKGITKANAAGLNGKILNIDLTISGKGTNDKLVALSKDVASKINNNNLNSSQDEIYTIIDNCFKS